MEYYSVVSAEEKWDEGDLREILWLITIGPNASSIRS